MARSRRADRPSPEMPMRDTLSVSSILLVAMLSAAFAAPQDSKSPQDSKPTSIVTLTGCVKQTGVPNELALTDDEGSMVKLTGSRLGKYLGQRVEVAGNYDRSRFKIKGGLWPNPNTAAQRDDPVRAAMAAQPAGPGSGTGGNDLPEFKVKSVRTVRGGCG